MLLLGLHACGFPRPPNVGDDDIPGDAAEPGTTIRVSPSGSDDNDGIAQPVKTIKHAIGLAAASTKVTRILLASGTYSSASGETFPYTIPTGITLTGPAGGGATLTGAKAGPGFSINTGGLQDIDLQDFTTAITATGPANLKNVRVLTSTIAVQAETSGKVTADHLDITGTSGACNTGLVLLGSADLTATALSTRSLGTTLDDRDDSTVGVSSANITGDSRCMKPVIAVTSTGNVTLADSIIDGGYDGLSLQVSSAVLQATMTRTVIRNLKNTAVVGGSRLGGSIVFAMSGGELSNNGRAGLEAAGGDWTLMNVAMRQNVALGISFQGDSPAPGKLTMRGCSIAGTPTAVYLFDLAIADLGTSTSPGGNSLQSNLGSGLDMDGAGSTQPVDAIGNVWRASVQGADQDGHYLTRSTIVGPVARVSGDNYSISNQNWTLHL